MSSNESVWIEIREQIDAVEIDASRPTAKIDDRYPTGWSFALVMTSLVCGVLLVAIDNTIIAVAIPKISTDFKALDNVGWYGSAYLLTETALQPTLGNFYKYFDVKLLYLISMIIFEGDDPPFHFLVELSWLTFELHHSRLNSVRCSFHLGHVHPGQSNRRHRCGRYLSRSSLHCRPHRASRKEANLPRCCPKLIYHCNPLRSNHRWCSHVKC